ncbi:hypothetical protein QQ045_004135 [Rhodiola kirilowii]
MIRALRSSEEWRTVYCASSSDSSSIRLIEMYDVVVIDGDVWWIAKISTIDDECHKSRVLIKLSLAEEKLSTVALLPGEDIDSDKYWSEFHLMHHDELIYFINDSGGQLNSEFRIWRFIKQTEAWELAYVVQKPTRSQILVMDGQQQNTAGAVHQIPNDVIYSIMLKLPTKSLVRFLTLSKEWKKEITSRKFSKRRKNISPVLSVSIVHKEDVELKRVYSFVIWNPYTGQKKEILLPQPKGRYKYENGGCSVVFGYDSTIEDYKIVIIFLDNNSVSLNNFGEVVGIMIGALRSDEWRIVYCASSNSSDLERFSKHDAIAVDGDVWWFGQVSKLKCFNEVVFIRREVVNCVMATRSGRILLDGIFFKES